MNSTVITIPAGTLSPHQIAAIIRHVEASLPYYQQGGLTLAAEPKIERQVEAILREGRTVPGLRRLW